MSGRLLGYALFCVALLAVAGGAARCYPPDTRVVVFVQGLYMTLDADGTHATAQEPHQFGKMKETFVANGYPADRLLDYSYNGGTVTEDGTWEPEHFSCTDTDQPVDESVSVLEHMLRDYKAAHDEAHFTLVGHSLGGYVAFLAGARDATRSKDERLDIDAVITLDAPLHGASADKKFVLDLVNCPKTYQAGGDLVAAAADPAIRDVRRYQAAAMAQDGIRLATLGNTRDCLYNTVGCTGLQLVDDTETQFVDNAARVERFTINASPFASHDVIVTFGPAIAAAIEFVGRP
jgi:pimeloyl-ACP methyl ester carboxylesterase